MCSKRNHETFVGADEATVLLGGAVKCLLAHATMLEFAEALLGVVLME